MSVNGLGATSPVSGALASIQKACMRLNPCMDLDVDVLAVVRAAQVSTYDDWQAAAQTNVTVDPTTGIVRIAETGTPTTIFSQTTGTPTIKHTFIDGQVSGRGVEEFAIDFFPDPSTSIGGVPFTLDSLDLYLGQSTGVPFFFSPGGFLRVSVGYYDTSWRLISLGDPIDIPSTWLPGSGGVYPIKFRADWNRRFVFDSGLQDGRTGTGFNGTSARAAFDPDSKGISHLKVARGLSISIQPSGKGFQYAYIGCYSSGTAALFDTTAFWRYTTAGDRTCGPYCPDNQPYPGTDKDHNPDNYLITGAVPGYGAKTGTSGLWGIARRVLNSQRGQDNSQGWNQPYHALKVVTYQSSGSIVATLDMGGIPTNPVEIRIDDFQPKGTSMAYSLRRSADGTSWTSIGTVVDGQILTGSDLKRYYELTATFTPGPTGGTKYVSPALQAWTMVERVSLSTYRYLQDFDSTVVADPLTGQSQIGELKLPVMKSGRVDFRDLGTQLGSNYAPSQLEAHMFARNTITGTRLFLNSYRLENRNPVYGAEEMIFVSGMDRLSAKIPTPSETYRWPLSGQGSVSSISFVSGTTYRVTPSGSPGYATGKLTGFRFHGVTGQCEGRDYTIVDNTDSTIDITVDTTRDTPPIATDTFELHSDVTTRAGAVYIGQDFASVYEDLLSVQSAVPSRYRGLLPATTGRLTSYTLPADGVKALDVLQNVALHCGGFPAWNKGKIDFVDFYGKKDSVFAWDDRHIVSLDTPVGADRRMPSVRMKYGYTADNGNFTNEVTYEDFDSLMGWGRSNLFDVYELPDDFCKWNDEAEARYSAGIFQKAWSSGVRLWKVKTVLNYPWLSQGDAGTIVTDQYSDRRLLFSSDGLTDQGSPVAGRVSAVAVIVGKNLWGNEFLVGVRGLDAVTSVARTSGISGSDPGETAGGLNNFRVIAETTTERTYGWSRGSAVDSVWAATVEFDTPLPSDPWADVRAASSPLPTGQDTLTVRRPFGKKVTLIQVEPRAADLSLTAKPWQGTLEAAPPQLPAIEVAYSESGDTGTGFAALRGRGETLVTVQVQTKSGGGLLSQWATPTRGEGDYSYVKQRTLAADEYEHDVLKDQQRSSTMQFRAIVSGTGEVITTDVMTFDWNDTPDILFAEGIGSVAWVMGDSDTKSVRLQHSAGTWEYWVDGPSVRVDVQTRTGNGSSGSQSPMGSGATWPITVTAYAAHRAEVDDSTPRDTASLVVVGSSTTPPVWEYVNVAAPSMGSVSVPIVLDSDTGGALTTKVTARWNDGSGFTTFADITSGLSPSLTTPPTSATTYTWAGLSSTYNRTESTNAQQIELEIVAEMQNAGVTVARETRRAIWYYGATSGPTPPTSGPKPDPVLPPYTPSAGWDSVSVTIPSVGSKVLTVTLDSTLADGTVQLLFRKDDTYGWKPNPATDIASLVSPAVSTPPTGSTAYTYTIPNDGTVDYTRVASGTPLIVEITANIVKDGVIVATSTQSVSWLYTDPRL